MVFAFAGDSTMTSDRPFRLIGAAYSAVLGEMTTFLRDFFFAGAAATATSGFGAALGAAFGAAFATAFFGLAAAAFGLAAAFAVAFAVAGFFVVVFFLVAMSLSRIPVQTDRRPERRAACRVDHSIVVPPAEG